MSVPGPTLDARTLAPTIVRFGTPYTGFTIAASVNASSSGDNTIIAGSTGLITRVYRIFLVIGGSTALTFKDGASNSYTGAMTFASGGSLVLDFQAEPWFIGTAGNGFVINSSNAVQISGTVYYVQA